MQLNWHLNFDMGSPHKRLPKDPNDTSGAALSPFVTNTALLIKDISYGFKSQ